MELGATTAVQFFPSLDQFDVRSRFDPRERFVAWPHIRRDPDMAGRRVLVVEDQQAAAESLGFFLELAGFDVQIALTGPSGLALALDWLPDVVLCDIGLPGLD